MANTYTLIASNTLGASAASVTFSSIPADYTDLVVRFSTRKINTSQGFRVTVNSITSGYSETILWSGSGIVFSDRASSVAAWGTGGYLVTDGTGQTSNTFGSGEFYIPSYTASQNKPISSITVEEDNSSGGNQMSATAHLLSNTAAITSITFNGYSGDWAATSSFYLYGISNA